MTRLQPKVSLVYLGQPLTPEQRIGQISIEDAVKLSQLVRSELLYSNQRGAPLLSNLAPPSNPTIAGFRFLRDAADQSCGRSRDVRRGVIAVDTMIRSDDTVCMPAMRELTFLIRTKNPIEIDISL